ncbi:MAG: hypothetical protein ACE5EN_01720 [Nitrospinota bacterium]
MEIKNRPANADYMLMNKPSYPRVSSWPNLVWIIFLMMIFITIVMWAVAFLVNAPLEEMAEWAKTPNPAKAPWYFIGLQELLVYFDPWIAGVMIPQQILVGLALIPFVDVSPLEQGKYSFSKRRFAVTVFTFGMAFWFVLIIVGQFLRGPSWNIYWPIIDYDLGGNTWVREGVHLKEVASGLKSLPLGTGLALLIGFAGIGMIGPVLIPRIFPKLRISKMIQEYLNALGPIRYIIVQSNVLLITGVVGKVFLRLVLHIKYVIETPWFKI